MILRSRSTGVAMLDGGRSRALPSIASRAPCPPRSASISFISPLRSLLALLPFCLNYSVRCGALPPTAHLSTSSVWWIPIRFVPGRHLLASLGRVVCSLASVSSIRAAIAVCVDLPLPCVSRPVCHRCSLAIALSPSPLFLFLSSSPPSSLHPAHRPSFAFFIRRNIR